MTPTPRFTLAPTLEDITIMADEALETIPRPLLEHVRGVSIHVEDFPDDETCRDMDLESPFDLLGLYVGTPFGHKSVTGTPTSLDTILLFRRPLLDYWCETGEDLGHLVRHVLIHEIGHHFGFSDEDMDSLERQA